jgi:hypothetical protein
MLVPVLIKYNLRVATSSVVSLEALAGVNLPLMDVDLRVFNRTLSPATVIQASLERTHQYVNQADAAFNGTVTESLVPATSVAAGSLLAVNPTTLAQSLIGGAGTGVTTSLTVSHSGPATEALVTVELRGRVEVSFSASSVIVVDV